MKTEMTGTHKERAKIYSFLGIIFFQIIQGVSLSSCHAPNNQTKNTKTYITRLTSME